MCYVCYVQRYRLNSFGRRCFAVAGIRYHTVFVNQWTYVVKPETWNTVHKPIAGSDEIHCHDESDALTERRPVLIPPFRLINAPLAFACYRRFEPDVTH